ncbi:persephin isoform X2 [Orcinus orca]|uniref:Persephin n=2 Tax=Delphinidae TaxID=9726 RepID=A0A6J3R6R7_TURTR|nr:persephin isoform X2 [Orcinus orca]XP_033710446.1 persephin isoform X2 [Tursiops truncatus]XP_059862539.1 persephin isoform X2 [Delphinus delphis]
MICSRVLGSGMADSWPARASICETPAWSALQDLPVTMATGRVLLGSLLLLTLHLDLRGGPGAWGASVAEEELLSEPVVDRGTWRPQLGTRPRRALAGPCQLWSLPLPVAELGLGYTSEETVIFRYCAGSCPRGARTQHGLTLARLRGQGRAHGGPCCRPTRYADVAFLDDRHRWQRLPQLSAAACGCGG